jgi:hypothetical protein
VVGGADKANTVSETHSLRKRLVSTLGPGK